MNVALLEMESVVRLVKAEAWFVGLVEEDMVGFTAYDLWAWEWKLDVEV